MLYVPQKQPRNEIAKAAATHMDEASAEEEALQDHAAGQEDAVHHPLPLAEVAACLQAMLQMAVHYGANLNEEDPQGGEVPLYYGSCHGPGEGWPERYKPGCGGFTADDRIGCLLEHGREGGDKAPERHLRHNSWAGAARSDQELLGVLGR